MRENASAPDLFRLDNKTATGFARDGINVNALAPGWFPTTMSSGMMERFEDKMLEGIPMHRFGNPEDIKDAILFLASPASNYITGQTMVVDGGQTAW